MKKLMSLLVILTTSVFYAYGQRYNAPTLEYNKGKLRMLNGKGVLYDLGGDRNAHKQNLEHIYYLFTDESCVYLSSDYNPRGKYGYTNLALDSNNVGCWGSGYQLKNKEEGFVIDPSTVQRNSDFGFHWEDRAWVVFDTKGFESELRDSSCSVTLIVLPEPPEDTIITHYDFDNKDIENGRLSGDLVVYRTGRIVFDSIWVDGHLLQNVTYNGTNKRDTPYYRNNPYAKAQIDIPVSKLQRKIQVKVFYRYFSAGNIVPKSLDIEIPIRSYLIYIEIAVAALLALLVVLLLRSLILRNKRQQPSSSELQEEIESLKAKLKEKDALIAEYNELLNNHQNNSNRDNTDNENAEFNQRCVVIINELAKIEEYLYKANQVELDQQVIEIINQIFNKIKNTFRL